MKRGTPAHPKIKALARRLKIMRPAAVGILEMAWQFAAEYAPAGDIGRYNDAAIAEAVGWPEDRDPGELVSALVGERWIDENQEHRLLIHDWPEHAEDSVHRKLARNGRYFADGTRPKLERLDKNQRALAEELYSRAPAPPTVVVPSAPGGRPRDDHGRGPSHATPFITPIPPGSPGGTALPAPPAQTPGESDPPADDPPVGKPVPRRGRPSGILPEKIEAEVLLVAMRIHGRHPQAHGRRDCSVEAVAANLRTIIAALTLPEKIPKLRQIDANHEGWCATEKWREEGGRFANGLSKWLAPTKLRYDAEPPSQFEIREPEKFSSIGNDPNAYWEPEWKRSERNGPEEALD